MSCPLPVAFPAGAGGRPHWSGLLRALREARGISRAGWAARLGYGLSTVQRWERGLLVPDAVAEQALLAACEELALLRPVDYGPLQGLPLTPAWLRGLLARARLERHHAGM